MNIFKYIYFFLFFIISHLLNKNIVLSNNQFFINKCIHESYNSSFYMKNCKEFHLWNLQTEGLHKKTINLSSTLKKNTSLGVKQLINVDKDIVYSIKKIINNKETLDSIEKLSNSIKKTILNKNKVYIYGCGSTGRLAKQLSFIWKNFWLNFKYKKNIKKNELHRISNSFLGIITGGDRALISSIEGFEDVQLIGSLQIDDYKFNKEDMIIGVTEGGETSSVIGATMEATKRLNNNIKNINSFFIFNNSKKDIYFLKRSKNILNNNDINKISLVTGNQGITGSTRMQATTISSFVIGVAMEKAIMDILKEMNFNQNEIQSLGFLNNYSIKERLKSFYKIHNNLNNYYYQISQLIDKEYSSYCKNKKVLYIGLSSGVTIFSDITERSPTFGIKPIDTNYQNKNSSIIKVILMEDNNNNSWKVLLGSKFKGLNKIKYSNILNQSNVLEKNLKHLAINGLSNAENNQQYNYDFSYKNFIKKNKFKNIGHIFIYLYSEDINIKQLNKLKFIIYFLTKKNISFDIINLYHSNLLLNYKNKFNIKIDNIKDPIGLNKRIFLKMLLNIQSTSTMAKLGYVVGNIMTNLKPANLKLIGRATNIIKNITNYKLKNNIITHSDANSILFNAINYKKLNQTNHSEIALSIIKLIESKINKKCITFKKVEQILNNKSLEEYLM